jgi:tetratricopeptide (TPR) repeat protein
MTDKIPQWPEWARPAKEVLDSLHPLVEAKELGELALEFGGVLVFVALWICGKKIISKNAYIEKLKESREKLEIEISNERAKRDILQKNHAKEVDDLKTMQTTLQGRLAESTLLKAKEHWDNGDYEKADGECTGWLEHEGREISEILRYKAAFALHTAKGERNVPGCAVANGLANAALAVWPENAEAKRVAETSAALQELEAHKPISISDEHMTMEAGATGHLEPERVEEAMQMQKEADGLATEGRYEQALTKIDRAVLLWREQRGSAARQTLVARRKRALVLEGYGKLREALAEIRSVVEECASNPSIGETDNDALNCRYTLYRLLNELNQLDEALEGVRKLIEIESAVFFPDHGRVLEDKHLLARILNNLDRHGEALTVVEKVLEERMKSLEPGDSRILSSCHLMARVLSNLGRLDEAHSVILKVLERESEDLRPDRPKDLSSHRLLADILCDMRRYQEAHDIIAKVIEVETREKSSHHPTILRSLSIFTQILNGLDRNEEAVQILNKVLPELESVLGADHWETRRARGLLTTLQNRHSEATV